MATSRILTKAATVITILLVALSSAQPAFAAPSNDNFADAAQITSLPFSTNVDTTGATGEAGEPANCISAFPLKTAWFAYTPSTNITLTAFLSYPDVVAVYTGNSVDGLGLIACAPYYYGQFSFMAQAGVTYYFQLSDYNGNEGSIPFRLEVTPPPQVNFFYFPSDPSVFDNVLFNSSIYDPAYIGIATYSWASSDGATSDQSYFNHQFAADGDYTVNLDATTYDGRSGSASQVIHVRTHDVAITSLSVPQTARVYQTKTINVDVKNRRYSEYVQVILTKGLPGGGEQTIGTLTLYVPARTTRATTFKFSYTFVPDDATVGKVTFRAVANIVNGRDALPSDNTAIATTLVSK